MNQEEQIKENANRRGVPIIREESHFKLQEITKKVNPKTILEIGTAVGYSGILMLEAAPEAKLITIELDKDKALEAKTNFKEAGLDDRVTVINADCSETVSLMVAEGNYDNYFDMIFLDGPKAQYIKMLESLIMLTKPKGTIIADNVLFRGYVLGDRKEMPRRFKTIVKRLEQLLETTKTHPELENWTLFEIEDGILTFTKK